MKTFTRVVLGEAHPIAQIRRSALCQSFHAKQNVAMISQHERDGWEMWSSAASCFPVIEALRPILLVEMLHPRFRSPLCNSYSSLMLVIATRVRIFDRLFGLCTSLRLQCKHHRRSAQSPFEIKSQRIEYSLRSGGRLLGSRRRLPPHFYRLAYTSSQLSVRSSSRLCRMLRN